MVLVNYFKGVFLTLLLVMIIVGITFYSINVYFPKVQKNKIMEEYNILNENFIKNENYINNDIVFLKQEEKEKVILWNNITFTQCRVIKENAKKNNNNYIVKNMFFNNDNVCHENIKNKVKYTLMIK